VTASNRLGPDFEVVEEWVRDHLGRCQAPGDHAVEDLYQVATHQEGSFVACTVRVRERPLERVHRSVAVVDLDGGRVTFPDVGLDECTAPAWSPDGSRLIFTSDSAGGPQLYTMPAAGGMMQRVSTNISGYCAEPDWSVADPNKIAFTMRIGRGYQIAVCDLSGRTPTKQVSKAPVDAVEPAWLADGRHLVYTERSANSRGICILDTETGKTTRVSPAQLKQTSQVSVKAP